MSVWEKKGLGQYQQTTMFWHFVQKQKMFNAVLNGATNWGTDHSNYEMESEFVVDFLCVAQQFEGSRR